MEKISVEKGSIERLEPGGREKGGRVCLSIFYRCVFIHALKSLE